MDVVNLHPLLMLFTIVILLAGLFFLYPAVSFNLSNNVVPPTPSGKQGVPLTKHCWDQFRFLGKLPTYHSPKPTLSLTSH